MSSIFLSHSHADKPFARKLAADLRAAGHTVWIDEAEINIGDSLIEKIREGLDQVDFVAAILSSASASSQWVTRELDIASNREIKEKRVVVLPLLVEKVPMPGFLEGKFYGDFTDEHKYPESFDLLLRKLGPVQAAPEISASEIETLKQQLKAAQAYAEQQVQAVQAHQLVAMRGKSPALVAAIEDANKSFPLHAPINASYAFEVASQVITLDYLLWAIGKATRKGGHPLEILFTIENKWPNVRAMLGAYSDLLNAKAAGPLADH